MGRMLSEEVNQTGVSVFPPTTSAALTSGLANVTACGTKQIFL